MKAVLVISPTYLTALHKESRKFSFAFYGFGSFSAACDGLLKINSGDLLGAAYVAEQMPAKGTHEYNHMENFLNLYDKLEDSKKFVVVLQEQAQGLNAMIAGLRHVRVFLNINEVEMTDTVINQKVFGSLLLDNTEPYNLTEEVSEKRDEDNYLLRLIPVISNNYLMCLDDVVLLQDYQTTLENDIPYQEYTNANQTLLAMLRAQKIARVFGLNDRHLNVQIEQRMATVADADLWCIYKTLQSM